MSAPRLPGTGTGRRRAGARPAHVEPPRAGTSGLPAASGTAELPALPDPAAPTPSASRSAEGPDDAPRYERPATWPRRALAATVDLGVPVGIYLLSGAASTGLQDVGNRPAVTALLLGYIWVLGWVVWQVVAQGRTGQSVGKRLVGLRVVTAAGSPTGVGRGMLRTAAHVLDLVPAGLGFAWPLWDHRRQTFADKLTGTSVVIVRRGEAG